MASSNTFLDLIHDMKAALEPEGYIDFSPKPELRSKAESMLHQALDSNHLTPGEASKLRGVLGFTALSMSGRVGRAGMCPLAQRQCVDTPPWTLSLSLKDALSFFLALLLDFGFTVKKEADNS